MAVIKVIFFYDNSHGKRIAKMTTVKELIMILVVMLIKNEK